MVKVAVFDVLSGISYDTTTSTIATWTSTSAQSHTFVPTQITPADVVIKASDGSVIIEGDFKLGEGQEALDKRLERIEKVLGIGPRRPSLEKEYPELEELGKRMDQAISELTDSVAKAISKVVNDYDNFAKECEVMEKLKSENGETKRR